jgi:hypothetical protein
VLYSEKMQWLKLHDKNPVYTQLCDKLAVREYVSRLAGRQYLIPLLGVWENPIKSILTCCQIDLCSSVRMIRAARSLRGQKQV